jgi:predicted phage tail protein
MRPKFRERIKALDQDGFVFRVRTKTHDYSNDDLTMSVGSNTRLDIIPIVRGSSAGVRFVVGSILLAASFITGVPAAWLPYIRMGAASLMLGAVSEWLAPVTPRQDYENKRIPSWTIDGAYSTVDQGMPVPVIYGEVLTSGYSISAGLSVVQQTPSQAVAADALIGGEPNPTVNLTLAYSSVTVELRYSISPINLDGPYTYSWSASGFPSKSAMRLYDTNKATVRIQLDYSTSLSSRTEVGTVSCQLTGIVPSTVSGSAPQQTTINKSLNINLAVVQYVPPTWDSP